MSPQELTSKIPFSDIAYDMEVLEGNLNFPTEIIGRLEDMKWEELKHYSHIIDGYITPFIKKQVDRILYESSLGEYTPEQVSFAIISLRNFFYSHNWILFFNLTSQRSPYIKDWINVLEEKE